MLSSHAPLIALVCPTQLLGKLVKGSGALGVSDTENQLS